MDSVKTFRVNYQTKYSRGCIKVYISNFFGNATLRTIDKLFRLAKVNCTSEQQNVLLMDLEKEKLVQTGAQCDRIEKCIKRLQSQTWGKAC